jgi:hypothetical protein
VIHIKNLFLRDHVAMYLDAPRIAADLYARGHRHSDADIIARTAEAQIVAWLKFHRSIFDAYIQVGCREHDVVHICYGTNDWLQIDRDGVITEL